jgi:hypothetical protein
MSVMRARGATVLLGWLLTLMLAAGIAAAQERPVAVSAANWDAIKRVITSQVDALRSGDAAKAYSYASAGIRQQFVDPQRFIAMVRGGYAGLLDARYTEFLEGAVIDGIVVQPLRLVLPDNTVLVALYQMQREGDAWRIAGCVLAPSTVKAA